MNGVISNKDRFRQIFDLEGMRWGKISPTDIDLFLDFKDRLFVIIEIKFADREFGTGQRLALERLVVASESKDRVSCAMICRHDSPAHDDVDVSALLVDSVYGCGRYAWRMPIGTPTLRQAIDRLIKFTKLEV